MKEIERLQGNGDPPPWQRTSDEASTQQRASPQPATASAESRIDDPPFPHRDQFASSEAFWNAIEQHPVYLAVRGQADAENAQANAEMEASRTVQGRWREPRTKEPGPAFRARHELIVSRRLERRWLKARLGKQEYTRQRRLAAAQTRVRDPHR